LYQSAKRGVEEQMDVRINAKIACWGLLVLGCEERGGGADGCKICFFNYVRRLSGGWRVEEQMDVRFF
jgi:hypothetical protein